MNPLIFISNRQKKKWILTFLLKGDSIAITLFYLRKRVSNPATNRKKGNKAMRNKDSKSIYAIRSFEIEKTMLARFDSKCKERGISRSKMIVNLIKQFVSE